MSKIKGFLGGVYKTSVVNFDCAETINWYPEMDEVGTGKDQEVLMLRTRPGLTQVGFVPRPPCRCLHQTQTGNIYGVFGNGVFQLKTTDGVNFTHTLITTLTTSTGRAYIQDGVPNVVNGQLNSARIVKVVVVDGSQTGVCFTDGAAVGQAVLMNAGNGFSGSSFVTFQDGFFLFSQPNTPVIQFAADPANISGEDTIVQNATADTVSRVLCDHDIAWVFNAKSCIIYQNTGGVGFFTPNNLFQNIPGSVSEGGAFPHTICQLGGQLLWLQTDKNGSGQVFEAVGYRGARISTHSEELAINQAGDLSLATAWSYQAEGHSWYCLNIPGMAQTLCYDIITKMWSQRCFFEQGVKSRDLVEFHYNVNLPGIGQIPLVADYQSGNLYVLDDENQTDNGFPIYRQRTTSHLSAAYKRISIPKLQVDLETGTGLDGLGYPFQNGYSGATVLTTASNVELLGNGPTYQFADSEGNPVDPLPTPTITASGPYSNSYTISGSEVTLNPVPLSVPLTQFAIGDGSTVSFNLNNSTGYGATSIIVYASDWRGVLQQSTTPRTNLNSYSIDFNKGWTATGLNANPSPSVTTNSSVSSITTVNIPSPSTPATSKNDLSIQAGWNQYLYTSNLTSRPNGFSYDSYGTYAVHGTGLPTGNSTSITTSSATNYITGSNTLQMAGVLNPPTITSPTLNYISSLIISGFAGSGAVSGTLFVSLSTSTSAPALSSAMIGRGCGEIAVQYQADQMTTWNTIADAVGAEDLSSAIPVSINLTVQNISTLKVRIIQLAQPYYTNFIGALITGSPYYVSCTDSFTVYDCAFVGAQIYPLNAPDGSSTGTALVEDGSNGFHQISNTYTSTAGEYTTFSIYATPGDPTRNLTMQIGSLNNLVAQGQFNLQTGSLVGSMTGNSPSYNIQGFTQAVPSVGVILVNTLVTASSTGLVAQIAPTVLQTPTNGNIITYAWSFTSGTGGVITSGTTASQITFNVGTANNLLLQCIVTVNGVQTIYTQYVSVVASTNIYRISITGNEIVSGSNTIQVGLVNTAYPLLYNNPVSIGAYAYPNSGMVNANIANPPIMSFASEPWNTYGATPAQIYFTVCPSVCQSGAALFATYGPQANSYTWSISSSDGTAVITGNHGGSIDFTASLTGTTTVTCNPGTYGSTSSVVITVLPSMKAFYPGNNGSGWIGIWGAQVESYAAATLPTAFIETVGLPLTDLITINSATNNILFGVAPLEDAVLSASYVVNAISTEPIQVFWSGSYEAQVPNIVYIGTNPQLCLQYSKDGGHTWSTGEFAQIGRQGEYLNQCIWRRLGRSRDWVWRLTCTDPVRCELIGHDIDAKVSVN